MPRSDYNSVVLVLDGQEFHLSDAASASADRSFRWSSPALSWADNDTIDVKLIHQQVTTLDQNIPGATAPHYHPSDADVGRTLSVVVTGFTDNDGFSNEGPFASAATAAVTDLDPTRSVPWSTTMMALASGTSSGYEPSFDFGSLADDDYTVGSDDFTVLELTLKSGDLILEIQPAPSDAQDAGRTLLLGGSSFLLSDATKTTSAGTANYTWSSSGLEAFGSGDRVAVALVEPVNVPAQGFVVSGAPYVGTTLTAHRGSINDPNGLPGSDSDYTYKWFRIDGGTETEISGETGATYALVEADLGKTVKARVSYTDDDGFAEELDSAATAAIGGANEGKGVWSTWMRVGQAESDFGYDADDTVFGSLALKNFTHRGTARTVTDLILNPEGFTLTVSPALGARDLATLTLLAEAHRLPLADATVVLDNIVLNWPPSWLAANAPGLTWEKDQHVAVTMVVNNSPATGALAITGTYNTGETLTADISDIADLNGLPAAADFEYQWGRTECTDSNNDGDISGETSSTYEVDAADLTCLLKVTVTFEDGDGFKEGPLEALSIDLSLATWSFTLSDTEITRGETDTVTATIRITNNHRYDVPVTVDLYRKQPPQDNFLPIEDGDTNLHRQGGGAVTLTIPANGSSATRVLVSPEDTSRYDPREWVIIARSGGVQLGEPVGLNILDPQDPPTITLSVDPATITEGGSFTVTGQIPADRLLVNPFTATLEVVSGADLLSPGQTLRLTFAADQPRVSRTFNTRDDTTAVDSPQVVIRVSAVESPVLLGDPPSQVSVTVRTAPAAPTNLVAEPGNEEVTLTWDKPVHDGASPITKYQYRQSTTSTFDSAWTDIPNSAAGGTNETSYTIENLMNLQQYYFRVRAVNDIRESAPSNADETTPVEGPSVGVSADPDMDEGSAQLLEVVLRYEPTALVGLRLNAGAYLRFGSSSRLDEGTQRTLFFTADDWYVTQSVWIRAPQDDNIVDETVAVTVRVTSTDTGYHELEVDDIVITVEDNDSEVSITADQQLVAEGETASFTLTRTGNEDPRDVTVRVRDLGNFVSTALPDNTVTVSFGQGETTKSFTLETEDDTVRESSSGTVTVRLESSDDYDYIFGTHRSATVQVMDDDGPPGPPAGLAPAMTHRKVTLTWEAPDPPRDSPVTGYQARYNDGDTWSSWTTTDSDTKHVFSGLYNGTSYTFQVRAVDQNGNGEAAGTKGSPTRETTADPNPPQNVFVRSEHDSSRPEIVWVRPSNASGWYPPGTTLSDSYSNILGYRIEVCTASDCGNEDNWRVLVGNTGSRQHPLVRPGRDGPAPAQVPGVRPQHQRRPERAIRRRLAARHRGGELRAAPHPGGRRLRGPVPGQEPRRTERQAAGASARQARLRGAEARHHYPPHPYRRVRAAGREHDTRQDVLGQLHLRTHRGPDDHRGHRPPADTQPAGDSTSTAPGRRGPSSRSIPATGELGPHHPGCSSTWARPGSIPSA